jgi:hypothetical protein
MSLPGQTPRRTPRSVPPFIPPLRRFDRTFPHLSAAVQIRSNSLRRSAQRAHLRTPAHTAVKPGGQVVAGSNPVSPTQVTGVFRLTQPPRFHGLPQLLPQLGNSSGAASPKVPMPANNDKRQGRSSRCTSTCSLGVQAHHVSRRNARSRSSTSSGRCSTIQ